MTCHWMGLHFEQSYWNTVPHFREFGGKKILVSRDLKTGLRLKCCDVCPKVT